MATVATISVNFAQYDSVSFTSTGVVDRSINPKTLSQYCLGASSGDFSYTGGFVKKTGDSISGYLSLNSGDPVSDNHAARKLYVDSRVFSLSSTINDSNSGFVKTTGGTMIGFLTLNTNSPTLALHAASKGYVDLRVASLSSTVDNTLSVSYLRTSGGNMSGNVAMNGNKITGLPVISSSFIDSDAVSKKYVDDKVATSAAGGVVETVPAGAIMPFARSTAPGGWLVADGSLVSRTAYNALFSAIGTTFGAGDGSNTFALPNLQGIFIRGSGSRSIGSNTYSATFGSSQGDQLKSHNHTGSATAAGAHSHTGSATAAGGHTHTGSATSAGAHTHTGSAATAGSHTHTISIGTAPDHTHTGLTTSGGAHTHSLTIDSGGAHGHTGSTGVNGDHAHNYDRFVRDGGGGYTWGLKSPITGGTTSTNGAHSHTVFIDNGGAHSHTGTAASAGDHSHTVSIGAAGAHGHTAFSVAAGDHSHTVSIGSGGDHSHTVSIGAVGDHSHTVSIDSGGTHSHTVSIDSTGGTETNPANIALLYCIKF